MSVCQYIVFLPKAKSTAAFGHTVKILIVCVFYYQFKKGPPKVPYKAIALATFLFLIGSLLIVIGGLLLSGYIQVSVSTQDGTFTQQHEAAHWGLEPSL